MNTHGQSTDIFPMGSGHEHITQSQGMNILPMVKAWIIFPWSGHEHITYGQGINDHRPMVKA